MELNYEGLSNTIHWEKANIKLPRYDYRKISSNTKENPIWVHFGVGNIFRGFIAQLQHELLNKDIESCGIVAVETFDFDIIDKIYEPYDNLSLLVRLNSDGTMDNEVIASIGEGLCADRDRLRINDIFLNNELQMVSFTITEKGYALRNISGDLLTIAKADMENGPKNCKHVMGILTSLMYSRYKNGADPIALVSMDNCSHNGDILKKSVLEIAKSWQEGGFVDKGFLVYLSDEKKVSFPWSMIDKITPRPSDDVKRTLENLGLINMDTVITDKNTFIAPFVNAEKTQYLVIEDDFPNGRPQLEEAGVFFVDRETVSKTETMKVTTCLNPLHTALAVFGCLLNFKSISDEIKYDDLRSLVERIGDEGLKVVVYPGIIDPKDFIREVLEERFPNPFIPDTPQRIATDTSQKIPIRFGETIKAYEREDSLNVESLTYIPLAIAGWLRYLLAVDDDLVPMEVSSDPMLQILQNQLKGIEVGKPESYNGQLKGILSNEKIFGLDLNEAGLSIKIESMFLSMIQGKGAVRKTLHEYVKD